ncbi:MAG: hypothetical protein WBG46_14300 [Nonlabens sp.]
MRYLKQILLSILKIALAMVIGIKLSEYTDDFFANFIVNLGVLGYLGFVFSAQIVHRIIGYSILKSYTYFFERLPSNRFVVTVDFMYSLLIYTIIVAVLYKPSLNYFAMIVVMVLAEVLSHMDELTEEVELNKEVKSNNVN